jgi:hypothetical protein
MRHDPYDWCRSSQTRSIIHIFGRLQKQRIRYIICRSIPVERVRCWHRQCRWRSMPRQQQQSHSRGASTRAFHPPPFDLPPSPNVTITRRATWPNANDWSERAMSTIAMN